MPGPKPALAGARTDLLRDATRFVLLSGACWCFDLALLLLLSKLLGWSPFAANVGSSLAAAFVVYVVAHRHVHDGAAQGQMLRTALYLCYTFGVIIAASALLARLQPMLVEATASRDLGMVLGKVLITPPQLLCNFAVSRLIARFRLSPAI